MWETLIAGHSSWSEPYRDSPADHGSFKQLFVFDGDQDPTGFSPGAGRVLLLYTVRPWEFLNRGCVPRPHSEDH